MSGYWTNMKVFHFLSTLTSEPSLTLHFFAKNSVSPIFFLPNNFLFIGQFIKPATFYLKIVYVRNLKPFLKILN